MRHVFVLAIALSFLLSPRAAVAQTATVAPADEYFGRYNESVLEIRNRLAAFDAKSDADAAAPGAVEGLDTLADAILAWKHKYANDPWIASTMSHLLKCYARTGFVSSPQATMLLSALLAAYPGTPQAREALVAVGKALLPASSAPAAAETVAADATVAGTVVDAVSGVPVSGAVVVVAADKESTDLAASPFATTGADGAFVVKDVPLGGGSDYIVVEPPSGSTYASYHAELAASGSTVAAGTIRLAAR